MVAFYLLFKRGIVLLLKKLCGPDEGHFEGRITWQKHWPVKSPDFWKPKPICTCEFWKLTSEWGRRLPERFWGGTRYSWPQCRWLWNISPIEGLRFISVRMLAEGSSSWLMYRNPRKWRGHLKLFLGLQSVSWISNPFKARLQARSDWKHHSYCGGLCLPFFAVHPYQIRINVKDDDCDLDCCLFPCGGKNVCLPAGGGLAGGLQRSCWIIHCWSRPSGHLRMAATQKVANGFKKEGQLLCRRSDAEGSGTFRKYYFTGDKLDFFQQRGLNLFSV